VPAIHARAIGNEKAGGSLGNEIVFDRNEYTHVWYLIE